MKSETKMKYHVPVLLKESIKGLAINPDGIYVDVTFGGGGHSRAILKHLTTGRLIALDQDSDAKANVIDDHRFVLEHGNFHFLRNYLSHSNIRKVDGIIADLGVSSHHFDTASRGFTYKTDAPLDMRMNEKSRFTASDIINTYTEERLKTVFTSYGELPNAPRLARRIVDKR